MLYSKQYFSKKFTIKNFTPRDNYSHVISCVHCKCDLCLVLLWSGCVFGTDLSTAVLALLLRCSSRRSRQTQGEAAAHLHKCDFNWPSELNGVHTKRKQPTGIPSTHVHLCKCRLTAVLFSLLKGFPGKAINNFY